MFLKAINTIIHNGETHKPGAIFEAEGTDAEVLIAGGFAVQSDEAPAEAEAEAPAAKTGKAGKPAKAVEAAAGGEGNAD